METKKKKNSSSRKRRSGFFVILGVQQGQNGKKGVGIDEENLIYGKNAIIETRESSSSSCCR